MTKKDLVKIINELVKREVKKQVTEIFIKENKSSLKSLSPKKKVVKKKIVKREPVQYTSNESLLLLLFNFSLALNEPLSGK